MVVEGRDDFVPEPGVRLLADEHRIAKQVEIVPRLAESLEQVFDLVLHVIDAEGRVHAGDLQRVEGALAAAGDFGDQIEVLLADALREFVDDDVNSRLAPSSMCLTVSTRKPSMSARAIQN